MAVKKCNLPFYLFTKSLFFQLSYCDYETMFEHIATAANDIERLSGLVGQDVLDKAALSSKGTYSEEDIENMMEYLSKEAQLKIAQHSPSNSSFL